MFELLLGLISMLAGLYLLHAVWSRNRHQRKKISENEPKRIRSSVVEHHTRSHLASFCERKLYFALNEILDERFVIHSQVSLIAVVEPQDMRYNARTWAKRLDFVITDKNTKILAVIELDDRNHQQERSKRRDAYVIHALKGHHPLIRIPARPSYDANELIDILAKQAGIGGLTVRPAHGMYEPLEVS